jgi:hypothetical protein
MNPVAEQRTWNLYGNFKSSNILGIEVYKRQEKEKGWKN